METGFSGHGELYLTVLLKSVMDQVELLVDLPWNDPLNIQII